jgi:Ca2+-dependent lipid-binding protein
LSGVVSIRIHEANDLEYRKISNTIDEVDNRDFPSTYAEVYLNDQKFYRTRFKPSNPQPYWNAAVERFVPNYKSSMLHVVVKDHKSMDNDPIMGIVALELAEIFSTVKIFYIYALDKLLF